MGQNNEQNRSGSQKDQSSTKREIGEGMHSLDSTQAPLKAETGEPDYDAMTDKGKNLRDSQKDSESDSSADRNR